MVRVEEHANAHRVPLSPTGPPLPDHCKPCSDQSDTPSLDVCVPCPPQTDRDCSQICFCDRPPKEGIINADLVRCQGNGRQCDIKFCKLCLREFGWWDRDNNKGPDVFCLQCMTKDFSNTMTTPIVRLRAHTHTPKTDQRLCHLKDTSMPLVNALCVGVIVTLLKKAIVEFNLMNGAVEIVRHIGYRHPSGPNQDRGNEHLEMYVVVKFLLSTATTHMIPGQPNPVFQPIL